MLSERTNYHPSIQTYELLTESGEVLKLSNLNLRKQLSRYYAYRNNLKNHHNAVNRVKKDKLSTFISENYDLFREEILHQNSFFDVTLLNLLYELRLALVNRIAAYNKAIGINKNIKIQL